MGVYSAYNRVRPAFTIVELLIVIVVIAILAMITVVAYNGITSQAKDTRLTSDLTSNLKTLQLAKVDTDVYPASFTPVASAGNTLSYVLQGSGFCLQATDNEQGKVSYVTQDGRVTEGECPVVPFIAGGYIQTAYSKNCPAVRTLAVDARDNRSYWIQKLADGTCWTLTNLAYAGGVSNGGANRYGDSKDIQDGTGDATVTYSTPKYYVHSSAYPTQSPATPSVATDGGAFTLQYGYLYNWCAAMGAQAGSAACDETVSPAPEQAVSICPTGWRLPTGGIGGEIEAMNNAINAGAITTDQGLRDTWLGQWAGYWYGGFFNQVNAGYIWSSTQYSAASAHYMDFSNGGVSPSGAINKHYGFSVRCVAQ